MMHGTTVIGTHGWGTASNFVSITASNTCSWDVEWYSVPYRAYETIKVHVPKNWRWFDVFRIWAEPKLLSLRVSVHRVILRVQERFPNGQRRKRKRRAHVQSLYKWTTD